MHPDRFQSLTVLPSVSHGDYKLIWKIWFHSHQSCDHKLSRPHWVTRGPDFDLIPWLIFTWPTDFESLNFHQFPDSIEWFRIVPKKLDIRELHDSTDLIHSFAIRLTDSAVICTMSDSTINWFWELQIASNLLDIRELRRSQTDSTDLILWDSQTTIFDCSESRQSQTALKNLIRHHPAVHPWATQIQNWVTD